MPTEIRRSTGIALAARITGLACWAGMGVAVARSLSTADRGRYAWTIALVAVLVTLGSGLAPAVAHAVVRRDVDPVKVRALVARVAFAGALTLALGLPVAALLDLGTVLIVLAVAVVAWPASLLRSTEATLAHADGRPLFAAVMQHGAAPLALFATLALAGLDTLGLHSVLAVWAVAQLAPLALGVASGANWTSPRQPPSRAERSSIVSFSTLATLVTVTAVLANRVDLLVIGLVDGDRGAGLYASASALFDLVTVGAAAVVLGTYRTLLSADEAESRRAVEQACRLAMVLVAIPALFVGVLASPIIELVYGDRYLGASGAVRVMMIAAPLAAPQAAIAAYFVERRGQPRLAVGIGASLVAVEAVLTAVLVPIVGIVGGAWATVAAHTTGLGAWVMAWRRPVAPLRRDVAGPAPVGARGD